MSDKLGSNYYAQFATPEGIVQLYLDLKIDAAEMKNWKPERIEQFFQGLAAAAYARFHE